MIFCGQYSEEENKYFSPPRGILFSFMKPCTQVITPYYTNCVGGVFNNLLRKKKNVSEVGGSNCQQPVGENAWRQGDMGMMWQLYCNINVITSYQ